MIKMFTNKTNLSLFIVVGVGKVGQPVSGSRPLVRRRTSDGPSPGSLHSAKMVAIVARNVPAWFNDKERLKEHFSQFGAVKSVYVNRMQESAIVHFQDNVRN